MQSLDDLARHHASLLIVDCASTVIQAGVVRVGEESVWARREGEAGTMLFPAVEEVLQRASLTLKEVGALAFNHGPGSILGIRTSAVALRSWCALYPKKCYAFNGLTAFALGLAPSTPGSFSAIADARRETWHQVSVDSSGAASACLRVPTATLQGDLIHPKEFRSWSARPPSLREVSYDVATLLPGLWNIPLFQETDSPDAFLHEEPTYQLWTPQVHRAPS